jgi:hypothetical protein
MEMASFIFASIRTLLNEESASTNINAQLG